MNSRGTLMPYLVVFFLLALAMFALIDPLKTNLDANRGGSTLNCPGTSDFNTTSYGEQTTFSKLVYRPTCFVTGVSMVWFVGAFLLAAIGWVYSSVTK